MEPATCVSMNVGSPTEDGRREGSLHFDAIPLLGPLIEKRKLAISEKEGSFDVDTGGVIVRIQNVVGTRSLFGNASRWACFELPIFKDCEIDAAPVEAVEPISDTLSDGVWIDRIGKVTGLGSLDFLNVNPGSGIASIGGSFEGGDFSALTPEVGLSRVVVVRKAQRRAILDDLSKVPSKIEPGCIVALVVVNLIS